MKSIRVIAILMVSLAALLTGVTAQPVGATPPEVQLINIDETWTAPGLTRICGFTVTRHDQGTARVHSFYRDGQLIRDVENDHLVTDFSANGHAVTGRTGGSAIERYNPDGSYSVMFTGPGDHIVVPGYGYVLGFVGNTLIEVDANGNETVIRDAGNNQVTLDAYQAVCSALAP